MNGGEWGSPFPVEVILPGSVTSMAPSDKALEMLASRQFARSPANGWRWVKYEQVQPIGEYKVAAWVDRTAAGWCLTTFDDSGGISRDTFMLDLEALLVFATVEGWI